MFSLALTFINFADISQCIRGYDAGCMIATYYLQDVHWTHQKICYHVSFCWNIYPENYIISIFYFFKDFWAMQTLCFVHLISSLVHILYKIFSRLATEMQNYALWVTVCEGTHRCDLLYLNLPQTLISCEWLFCTAYEGFMWFWMHTECSRKTEMYEILQYTTDNISKLSGMFPAWDKSLDEDIALLSKWKGRIYIYICLIC